jgi:hypothetical protein
MMVFVFFVFTAGETRDCTHSVFHALSNSLVTDTRIFQLSATWITESVTELKNSQDFEGTS